MTLIKTQVKTYRIDKVCDKCKEGLLIANGTAYHYNFYSTYIHVCNKCGNQVYINNEKYPHEITEDIGKPKRVEEPEFDEQLIENEINYNNLCAKATLGNSNSISVSSNSGDNTITQVKPTLLTETGTHLKRNPNTL